MQIQTNTLADRTQLLQNDGLTSLSNVSVSEHQDKAADDFAAAYGVEISDAGRQLQEAGKQRNDALLSDVPVPKDAIEVGEPIEPLKNEGPIFFLTDDNWAEVFSLATDMEAIESHLSSMIEDPMNYWNVGNLQELGKALNGYSHKQERAIRSGKDTYLQSIQDRLDILDGDEDGTLSAGSVQKKSSLEDGLAAYHHDRAIVHLIAEDAPADYDGPLNYGVRADGTVVERPNEETHNSARGYDWASIMKTYRQEHSELENAIRWERVA